MVHLDKRNVNIDFIVFKETDRPFYNLELLSCNVIFKDMAVLCQKYWPEVLVPTSNVIQVWEASLSCNSNNPCSAHQSGVVLLEMDSPSQAPGLWAVREDHPPVSPWTPASVSSCFLSQALLRKSNYQTS